MKIRIIGYAGSGKTSLAIKLQEIYQIQGISLDDYLKIKNKEQRFHELNHRLKELDHWIVEGVQVSQWTKQSFREADLVVILDYPIYICQYRVCKRAIRQFFEKGRTFAQRQKALKRMFKLFKWNHRFKLRLPDIKTNLYSQSAKVMILEEPSDEYRVHDYLEASHPTAIKKKKRKKRR